MYARHNNIKVSTDVTVTLDETEPPEKKKKLADLNGTHSGVGNRPEGHSPAAVVLVGVVESGLNLEIYSTKKLDSG